MPPICRVERPHKMGYPPPPILYWGKMCYFRPRGSRKGGGLPFKDFLSQFLIGFATQNKYTFLYFSQPFRLRFL